MFTFGKREPYSFGIGKRTEQLDGLETREFTPANLNPKLSHLSTESEEQY